MPISKQDKEFAAYLVDLMQSVGPVRAKSMFGGHGLFLNDLMFGLVADKVLYLKVDANSEKDFIEMGLEAFTYYKKDKEFRMSYYQCPEEALEDSDEMNIWANKGYAAAIRAAAKKTKK